MGDSGSFSARATERSFDENSSARIFIRDGSLRFAVRGDVNNDDAAGNRDLVARAVEPLDQGNRALRIEIFFQAGAENLLRSIEPIKVEVKAGQAARAIFIHQSEGGGMDAFGDAEAGGEAFDELSFAGTKIADKSKHKTRLSLERE